MSWQLTLWDNEALEAGYRHLSYLRMEEAKLKFQEALRLNLGTKEELEGALKACDYWLRKLNYSQEAPENYNPSNMSDLLLCKFIDFPFTSQMKYFRIALLSHIGSVLSSENPMDLDNVETTFDLLINAGKLNEAENLILNGMNQYPDNPRLHYMQAHVHWANHEINKANSTYIWLFLHYPGEVEKNRIQNKELLKLVDRFGAPMAAVFAWLYKIVPSIAVSDQIKDKNIESQSAIECYHLIHAANQALTDHDPKSSLQHRKRLKELSPELFDAYLKSLGI